MKLRWLVLEGLALLGLLAFLLSKPSDAPDSSASAPAPLAGAQSAAVTASAADLAPQRSANAARPEPVAMTAAAMLAADRDDCAQQQRALHAAGGRLSDADVAARRDRILALAPAMERWMMAQLGQRQDPYARALIELWAPDEDGDPMMSPAERHRQVTLAQQSHDGPLLRLAALKGCENKACKAQLAGRLTQLEPENAMGWLLLLEVGEPGQAVQALSRIAAASRWQTHSRDLSALAESLPKIEGDGPHATALQFAWTGRWHAAPLMLNFDKSFAPACKLAPTSLCEAALERLWQLGPETHLEALSLTKAAEATLPIHERPVWLERRDLAQAVTMWLYDAARQSQETQAEAALWSSCRSGSANLIGAARRGDWDHQLQRFRASQLKVAELAAQYRSERAAAQAWKASTATTGR